MPLRSPKMYSFILGFQRLVWCPKWTPASSNSFMVMLANKPPCWISSVAAPLRRIAVDYYSRPSRLPEGAVREELKTPHVLDGRGRQRSHLSHPNIVPTLALAELEALTGALLAVLFALLTSRIAG